MSSVSKYYGAGSRLERILDALAAQGKDVEHLTAADLAPVDEFHIRGREASVEGAELAAVQADWRVLDVGSGLGGPARFLADRYGCHVTGIDLTPEFVEMATELSRRAGLQALTEFQCASATAMPFPDAAFHLAWTQHVQMNIEDKAALYGEVRRVLRPGGRFVFHDIFTGSESPIHFPVPWADEPALSFLIDPDEVRALLDRTGFEVLSWRETTAVSLQWIEAMLERRRSQGAPQLGLQLLLGETAPRKFDNLQRNLAEGRLTVVQALLERR